MDASFFLFVLASIALWAAWEISIQEGEKYDKNLSQYSGEFEVFSKDGKYVNLLAVGSIDFTITRISDGKVFSSTTKPAPEGWLYVKYTELDTKLKPGKYTTTSVGRIITDGVVGYQRQFKWKGLVYGIAILLFSLGMAIYY